MRSFLGSFLFGLIAVGALLGLAMTIYAYTPPTTYQEDRGVDAATAYDRLPYLRIGATAHQVSSADVNGGNNDGAAPYYYLDGTTGGYVVLEENHPGTIYRIWATDLKGGNIRFYFDGEASPRIDVAVTDFFSGSHSPFLSPLVGNNLVSSGGYYSYYPIAFAQSLKIEFTNVPSYYNISYELYSTSDGVVTYDGSEDVTNLYSAWNNLGVDPKSTTDNVTSSISTFQLAAGQSKVLFTDSGTGSIRQVHLTLPQIFTTQYPDISTYADDGRAYTGEANFDVTIDPDHDYIELDRRFDYNGADQKADVYVDGTLAGTWYTPGNDAQNYWKVSPFYLPQNLTSGKSSIHIRIVFVSAAIDWNEFYYWVKSHKNGVVTTTDTLDVGNGTSESAHSYIVTGQTFAGSRTYTGNTTYPTANDPDTFDIMQHAKIQIYWDGEETPSVDVPLGYFFGQGTSGEGKLQSLMTGVDLATHNYYNYFPMPYGSSAQIVLVNDSSADLTDVSGSIVYNRENYFGLGTDAGYFKATYSQANPPTTGRDFSMLDLTSGAGRVVGVVQNIVTSDNLALEGDESIFIDRFDATNAIHGTGTEDFYNGGFYFDQGMFSLPVHGAPIINYYNGNNYWLMYRWFLSDSIPFENGIKMRIEHGPANNISANYESTVFYYLKSDSALSQSDQLIVGDATSESNHSYTISGQTWTDTVTKTYLGRDDGASYTGSGRAFTGYSQFTMAIPSNNHGIRLGRIFDHSVANQKASVYVDGSLAGTWYDGGTRNGMDYSFFEIPSAMTEGKSSITIKVAFVSSANDWNEFQYTTYAHTYNLTYPTPSPSPSPTPSPSPSPSPTPIVTSSSAPSANQAEAASGTDSQSSSSCTDTKLAAPELFQIDVQGTSAKLFFTPLSGANRYYFSYSTRPDAEEHGVEVELAREGVQNYTIYALKPYATYYFKVRGQNGCMPGAWSNIFSVHTKADGWNNVLKYYLYATNKKVSSLFAFPQSHVTSPRSSAHATTTTEPSQPSATPQSGSGASPEPSHKQRCFLWWCF